MPTSTHPAVIRRGRRLRADLLPAGTAQFSCHAALLLFALALLNGSNYVFHVVASRLLGPADYGTLAALLAVLMVLSVPLGVVQTVVAKQAALWRAGGREQEIGALAAAVTKALVPVGAAGCTLLLVATPLVASFLSGDALATALIAPYVFVSLLAAAPIGALQGALRFGQLVAVTLFGLAIRLGAGVAVLSAGFGVPGAMTAIVLSQLGSLALAIALLHLPAGIWRAASASLAVVRGEFAPALLGLGSFWLLAEVDLVLARHYLGEDAGFYSSAVLVARGALFLVAAISLVALPRFAETRGSTQESLRWLRLTLATVGVLSLLAITCLVLLRVPVITLAFGPSFGPASALVPLLAVGALPLALANVLVYFHIAAGTRAYMFVFAGVVSEVTIVGLFHDGPYEIAAVAACAATAVTVLQLHAATAVARWSRPGTAPKLDAVRVDRRTLIAPPTLELSVVLPCRNSGCGLAEVLAGLATHLEGVDDYEVIVVSDGSTDDTVRVAELAGDERVRVLQYADQVGKGQALRVGLGAARGRYIAFMDSDGDIDPASLRPFPVLMSLYDPDIVLGSKRHPLSEVEYPRLRRVLSWAYHKLGRLLFRVDVRDTQAGLKLIRRDVLAAVLPRMLEKRYAFDLELLVVARSLGYRRVFEAPIRLRYRFASRVDAEAALRIFLDTLAIFYRRYVLDTYRDGGRIPAAAAPASSNGALRPPAPRFSSVPAAEPRLPVGRAPLSTQRPQVVAAAVQEVE